MSSGPISAHILARDDAIAQWRKLMGPTRALQAMYKAPNCLRGIYGLSDTKNSVHGSDSDKSAKREIEFYFPEFSIEDWLEKEEVFFRKGIVTFDPEVCQHVLATQAISEQKDTTQEDTK
jgi:nucleoside-diphosphate kinase